MPPGHGYTGGSMALDPLAGHHGPGSVLVDVRKLTGVLLCRSSRSCRSRATSGLWHLRPSRLILQAIL